MHTAPTDTEGSLYMIHIGSAFQVLFQQQWLNWSPWDSAGLPRTQLVLVYSLALQLCIVPPYVTNGLLYSNTTVPAAP